MAHAIAASRSEYKRDRPRPSAIEVFEYGDALRKLTVAPEILEMAEEIAAGADGPSIEHWRLE